MQFSDTHLSFLRDKISDMQVALFKSEINSELTLPNNIIRVLKTDEEGNVYFFTSCRGCYTNQIDQPFYAYLDFHKKHSEVRLQISGRACIVRDEDGSIPLKGSPALIKLKMMQAEYFDPQGSHNTSWAQRVKATFNHIFFSASSRQLNFG